MQLIHPCSATACPLQGGRVLEPTPEATIATQGITQDGPHTINTHMLNHGQFSNSNSHHGGEPEYLEETI